LVASADGAVVIYNSSEVREAGVRFLTKQPASATCPASRALLSVNGLGSSVIPETLVALSDCRGATVLEALLPYSPPITDIGWMRVPIVLAGLAIVFAWQFFRGPSSRRRRGRDSSSDDMAGMAAALGGGSGRLGRGFDAAAASAKFIPPSVVLYFSSIGFIGVLVLIILERELTYCLCPFPLRLLGSVAEVQEVATKRDTKRDAISI